MKRALLVGIDQYTDPGFSSLGGAVNDVDALGPLISRNADGSPNFDCKQRTTSNGDVTRDPLLLDLDALLAEGGDLSLFYFAGHGVGKGKDVKLVTQDGTSRTPGIAFSEVLEMIGESGVPEVIVILDCCFAGAAGRVPQLGSRGSVLRDGLTIMAASRDDQTSAETRAARGLFSTYLEGGLLGGAADVLGRVTIAGLYAYLDEAFGAWGQRPTFKANVHRLHELRRCSPAVPLADLRRVAEFFPRPDLVFALDPSYEPTAKPGDADHEAMFAILQRYRAAHLVEPLEADHLYDAAMQSTGCRLTPLGQRYQHVAADGRI